MLSIRKHKSLSGSSIHPVWHKHWASVVFRQPPPCDQTVSSSLAFLHLLLADHKPHRSQTRTIQASSAHCCHHRDIHSLTKIGWQVDLTGKTLPRREYKLTSAGSGQDCYQGLQLHHSRTTITTSLLSVSSVYLLLKNFKGTLIDFYQAVLML